MKKSVVKFSSMHVSYAVLHSDIVHGSLPAYKIIGARNVVKTHKVSLLALV